MNKSSYTAADSIPIKVVSNPKLVEFIAKRKVIPPVHVQFIPTNRCNMHCSFCSCARDDRKTEMAIADAEYIIALLSELGTKAVTITGGGEPLLYPKIMRLLWDFAFRNIQIGLVTNGLLLDKKSEALKPVTWCRISNDDSRTLGGKYQEQLSRTILKNQHVDWAFSHVVSSKPNIREIVRVIEFANEHEFTHVRLVADLLDYENVNMPLVKVLVNGSVDTSRVIWQERNHPERGMPCYICYLKPLIGPDCKVYACCGVQYALKEPSKTLPDELCLGSAFDLPAIIEKSDVPFNGSRCYRCYYGPYNRLLGGMLSDLDHEDFV